MKPESVKKDIEGNPRRCEVCEEELIGDPDICGCEKCGRLFGPCCNSVERDFCVECV